MIRKLKGLFRRRPRSRTTSASQPWDTPTNDSPPDYGNGDGTPVDTSFDPPGILFDDGRPPPATRWSAPPRLDTPTASSDAHLYRDRCIRLNRQVFRLDQDVDRLYDTIVQLDLERDRAVMGQSFHWDNFRRVQSEADQVRTRNVELQQRIECLEQKRFRRIMQSSVDDAELRARQADRALRNVRRQLEESENSREELEDELRRLRDRLREAE